MGTDDRGYDILRMELIAGNPIHSEDNLWQAILHTEKGTISRAIQYKRWEIMAGDTIYREEN